MKLSTMLWTAALLVIVFFAFGCGSGGSDGPSAIDSITIDSITPSIVTAGTTTFTISVSYSLQTKGSGVIKYGFQSGSSSYPLENDNKIVSKGTGTALFIATKNLTETNTVHVLLAEYPQPATWSPLVSAHQTIVVN